MCSVASEMSSDSSQVKPIHNCFRMKEKKNCPVESKSQNLPNITEGAAASSVSPDRTYHQGEERENLPFKEGASASIVSPASTYHKVVPEPEEILTSHELEEDNLEMSSLAEAQWLFEESVHDEVKAPNKDEQHAIDLLQTKGHFKDGKVEILCHPFLLVGQTFQKTRASVVSHARSTPKPWQFLKHRGKLPEKDRRYSWRRRLTRRGKGKKGDLISRDAKTVKEKGIDLDRRKHRKDV